VQRSAAHQRKLCVALSLHARYGFVPHSTSTQRKQVDPEGAHDRGSRRIDWFDSLACASSWYFCWLCSGTTGQKSCSNSLRSYATMGGHFGVLFFDNLTARDAGVLLGRAERHRMSSLLPLRLPSKVCHPRTTEMSGQVGQHDWKKRHAGKVERLESRV
jgi:hypothetical protein